MPQTTQNRLLALMPPDERRYVLEQAVEVPFKYKMALYVAGRSIEHVYFPIEGVASLVNTMNNGSAAEVGTIGNEGLVGIPVILGDRSAPTDIYMQVEGKGLRLPAPVLTSLLDRSPNVRKLMLHYVHAVFNQVAQSAACLHFHHIDQRACRWILMTHDRVQTDSFSLTQDFLAMMLGVRRSSVTDAAQQLKKRGLINYSRGHVTILDRLGLEQSACECYQVSKQEFDRLLCFPDAPRE